MKSEIERVAEGYASRIDDHIKRYLKKTIADDNDKAIWELYTEKVFGAGANFVIGLVREHANKEVNNDIEALLHRLDRLTE